MKRIDYYIIRKFLGTYFLCIALIVCIAVVFDVSEKLDNFFDNHAPFSAVVVDYYLNFIPYFVNLFSPLFTFIAVIFFTSKLAENSEIIAMLAGGVSFRRLMMPYLVSATVIAALSFYLGGYVIPNSNRVRLEFEDKYVKKVSRPLVRNIQLEVEPNVIAYLEQFDEPSGRGTHLLLDRFEGKGLESRLTASYADYLGDNRWTVHNYLIRRFEKMSESITSGAELDTLIEMQPADFFIVKGQEEQMKTYQLYNYLEKQRRRGVANIKDFEIEYHRRFASPFAAFILTIIGVSLSSERRKGGMGLNLGLGFLLSFSYILFGSFSSAFAVGGSMPTFVAVWLPNVLFALIAWALYRRAPK